MFRKLIFLVILFSLALVACVGSDNSTPVAIEEQKVRNPVCEYLSPVQVEHTALPNYEYSKYNYSATVLTLEDGRVLVIRGILSGGEGFYVLEPHEMRISLPHIDSFEGTGPFDACPLGK